MSQLSTVPCESLLPLANSGVHILFPPLSVRHSASIFLEGRRSGRICFTKVRLVAAGSVAEESSSRLSCRPPWAEAGAVTERSHTGSGSEPAFSQKHTTTSQKKEKKKKKKKGDEREGKEQEDKNRTVVAESRRNTLLSLSDWLETSG